MYYLFMKTDQIPCTIRQIGKLTGEENISKGALILDDEPYVYYNGQSFEEFSDTASSFIANIEFEHEGTEYIFELALTPEDEGFIGFEIIPDSEFQEMKIVLSKMNLNSKIAQNKKNTKSLKI